MDLREVLLYTSVCVCLFVQVTCVERIPEPVRSSDSGDVIMREDAEEMFYNVDLEKYNELGIHCPVPEPPENGVIEGEGKRVGSVVYVICKPGFLLHGPTVMACVPNGVQAQWDPVIKRECVEGTADFHESEQQHEELLDSRQLARDHQQMEMLEEPQYIDASSHKSWMMPYKQPLPEHVPEEERETEEEGNMTEGLSHIPLKCLKKADTGPCKALFHRFYFDKHAGECRHFVYGGCLGNENNFETLEDCDLTCSRHQ